MTANQNFVSVRPRIDGGEPPLDVLCEAYEPDSPVYRGEMLLAIYFNGAEEAGVVLTADQAAMVAQLLTGGGDR